MPQRIGEIIEASTTGFVSGAYELLAAPPFGSLVRAQSRDPGTVIYGLVYDIRTGSRDPGGRAAVRGRSYSGRELFDDEIYREHPDLAEVLQTEFTAITVGFGAGGAMAHHLPAQPPPVHYSVYGCTVDELCRFSDAHAFYRTVLAASQLPADELIAAAVRAAAAAHADAAAYRVRAGRALAALLADDHGRLRAILQRIAPLR
jgi:hypothetical protein